MKFYRTAFRAMACDNEVQLFSADPALAARAVECVMAEVRRIEEKYSRYRADSVTSRLNRDAGIDTSTIDPETAFLLRHASACFEISGGRFDITSGVLRRAWNFKAGVRPDQRQLEALLPLVGWSSEMMSADGLSLPRIGMEIDFGGLGKEYAVDRACAELHALGIGHALVSLGGDVRVLGPRPDGSGWPVYVAHPRQPGAIVTTLQVSQGAVATSGDYQRFFDADGKRYCHVLNPFTGQPTTTWQSASILSAMSLDAGSISTIAMLMEQDALSFLRSRGENALMIDQSGICHGVGELQRSAAATPR